MCDPYVERARVRLSFLTHLWMSEGTMAARRQSPRWGDQVLGLLPSEANVGDVVQVPGFESPAPAQTRQDGAVPAEVSSAAYHCLRLARQAREARYAS